MAFDRIVIQVNGRILSVEVFDQCIDRLNVLETAFTEFIGDLRTQTIFAPVLLQNSIDAGTHPQAMFDKIVNWIACMTVFRKQFQNDWCGTPDHCSLALKTRQLRTRRVNRRMFHRRIAILDAHLSVQYFPS